ncbi:MAG: tetratricopeptide repeat protein [Armatimonadetes bacterium]|nr:tetratricopeptide repeat protein [Armatimonadota bacterium]
MSITHNSNKDKEASKLSSLMKQADYLAQQGLYDEAIAEVKKAIAIFPHEPECSVQLADLYRAQKKIGPAIEAMKTAVHLDPNNLINHEQLLEALLDVERYDEIIKRARRMLRTFPRSLYARDVLAISYLQKGQIDESLRLVNELINFSPRDPSYQFRKAVLLQQKGLVKAAMTAFNLTLELDPRGDLASAANEALASLDSYQLGRILAIASEDVVFRTKLMRDPEAALKDRGYALSPNGIAVLRNMDVDQLPGDKSYKTYH